MAKGQRTPELVAGYDEYQKQTRLANLWRETAPSEYLPVNEKGESYRPAPDRVLTFDQWVTQSRKDVVRDAVFAKVQQAQRGVGTHATNAARQFLLAEAKRDDVGELERLAQGLRD